MSNISLQDLLMAGAHFGHVTRRWNPKMRPYIFMEKSGIHIIDLHKTLIQVEKACAAVSNIVKMGGKVLFIGTKKQAAEVIKNEATRSGMHYANERWLGGMLTNFTTIRRSTKHLKAMELAQKDGSLQKMTKKELGQMKKKYDKINEVLGGVREMQRLPRAAFIVDIKKESIAVRECRVLGIPIIAICDTNTDPTLVDFPIPANDDAYKSISLITKAISDAVLEGISARPKELTDDTDDTEESTHDRPVGDVDDAPAKKERKQRKPATTKRS